MRISTTMVMKTYADNLESNLGRTTKLQGQLSSSRAFDNGSDDPIAAIQTVEACHEYSDNQVNQKNVSTLSSWMNSCESTVKEMNSIIKSAIATATEAANGVSNTSDYNTFAESFDSYRSELLTELNSSFSGRYIFGEGTNTDITGTKGFTPFKLGAGTGIDQNGNTVDLDGKLLFYNYNNATLTGASKVASGDYAGYVAVSSLSKSDVDALRLTTPVDLNFGMQMKDGKVVTDTAFNSSVSGLDAIIYNFTSAGSINIVDQMSEAIKALKTGSNNTMSGMISSLDDAQASVLKVNTDIGEKSKLLSAVNEKLINDEENLTERLGNVMEIDTTKVATQLTAAKVAYKQSMAIVSSVLDQSLIDFLK